MTSPIAIVGAGGWGTALAVTIARSDKTVRQWVYEPDLAAAIRESRQNAVYLPGVHIPDSVHVSTSLEDVLTPCRTIIVAVPSHVFRSVIDQIAPLARPDMTFVSAAKGIENQTLMRMSEVIGDVLGSAHVAVLSGPTFAPEVARGEPTALVIASPDETIRRALQTELSSPRFRLYTNSDVVGVEIGAAVKNIIAIAAGVVDGLGFGSNVTAALVTRGLAEITRLAVACGGRRETLAGLTGLGDLALTCYGTLSRNRQVGIALGRGLKPEEITGTMRTVAEGVKTTKSTVDLAHKLRVEMPIVEKMYSVLYEGLQPHEAINELMERKLKEE